MKTSSTILIILNFIFITVLPLFTIWLLINLIALPFKELFPTFHDFISIFLIWILPGYFFLSLISTKFNKLSLLFMDLREPTQEEAEIVIPLISDVKSKCDISQDVSIFIYDDETDMNAMALGNAVILSTSLIRSADEMELSGVIAHEFGHIFYNDSDYNSIVIFLSYPFQIIASLSNGLNKVFESQPLLRSIIALPFTLLTMVLSIFYFIFLLLTSRLSRAKEFRADQFAANNGYSNGLYSFLKKILVMSNKQSLFERLRSSHPATSKRMLRLEKIYQTTL